MTGTGRRRSSGLAAIMHFITDEEDAYDIVRAYMDAFAPVPT